MNAPQFLRKRQEPAPLPALPATEQNGRPKAVIDFLTATDQMREENAYLRSELEQTQRDLKLSHEQNRRLESELTNLRADHQILDRHDGDLMNSLDNIVTVILAAQAKARDHAYAPPGSGNKTVTKQADELAEGVAELAKKLAPENRIDG